MIRMTRHRSRRVALLAWIAAAVIVVATVQGCDNGAAGDGAPPVPGQQTYQRFCFSCHTTGAAGAPVTGDSAAWAPRIAQGREVLVRHTVDGMPPGMPARGLCLQCTDEELAAAVDYIVAQSR